MSDRRTRQKEQRAAKREQEKKEQARKELGRRLLTALGFGLVVVTIFFFSGVFSGDDEELPTGYDRYRGQSTACEAGTPPPETVMVFDAPAPQTDITPGSIVTATLDTSCGEIVIELATATSPETVNSFVFLSREGFYSGQVFHRIVQDFVIQGGDPNADGTGGPGYVIADEFPAEGFVYEEGVVAMANRGARSTGSQFFVVAGDAGRFLVNSFNVLGNVVSGEDTLTKILETPTGQAPGSVEDSLPLESVYINTIEIAVADS